MLGVKLDGTKLRSSLNRIYIAPYRTNIRNFSIRLQGSTSLSPEIQNSESIHILFVELQTSSFLSFSFLL